MGRNMKKILLSLSILLLTGCSVYMAADKSGTDIASVQKCNTRIQFVNLGAQILSSERMQDGTLVEIYRVKAEKGSAIRSVMHGLLDLSTGFLWELAGTPIEAALNQDKFMTVKVTYDAKDTVISAEFV